MSRCVFLLEGQAEKLFLEALLPRLFPELDFLCVCHDGKNDLEKSIPRKLRAWDYPDDIFVIVRDSDGADCIALKKKLVGLCQHEKRKKFLVRIACQELESWYLGDLSAIDRAYGVCLSKKQAKNPYRIPDKIGNPSREVKALVKEFKKLDGARRMGALLHPDKNLSQSFRVFASGMEKLLGVHVSTCND